MTYTDGFDAVLQRLRESETCSHDGCTQRAVILRNGALYCIGHVPQYGTW